MDVLPLAPLQQGLVFHAAARRRAAPTPTSSSTRSTWPGRSTPRRLRAAADALLARHPNLRARFRQLPRPRRAGRRPGGAGRRGARSTSAASPADERAAGPPWWRPTTAPGASTWRPPARPLHPAAARRRPPPPGADLPPHRWPTAGRRPDPAATCWPCTPAGEAAAALPPAPPYRDHLAWLAGRDDGRRPAAWRRRWPASTSRRSWRRRSRARTAPGRSPTGPTSSCPPRRTAALRAAARPRASRSPRWCRPPGGWSSGCSPGATTWCSARRSRAARPRCRASRRWSGLLINTVPGPGHVAARRAGGRRARPAAVAGRSTCSTTTTWACAALQRAAGRRRAVRHAGRGREHAARRGRRRAAGRRPDRSAASRLQDATHYPVSLIVIPGERLRPAARPRSAALRRRRSTPTAWPPGWCACWRRSADRPRRARRRRRPARATTSGRRSWRRGTPPATRSTPPPLVERIAAQAAATPDAEAVVCERRAPHLRRAGRPRRVPWPRGCAARASAPSRWWPWRCPGRST